MSLRIWLPLNGDLENKGLDGNITVTNNNATINNSGKIGKCYYFNGSAQYLQLSETLGDIYCGDFSLAVWLKPEDDTRGIIISEYSSTGSSNVAFELLANRVIRVYWNGAPDINTGVSIEKDKWSHVTITKKDDTIKVYVNGELKATRTQTLSDQSSTSKIRIGDDYRGGTGVSYMGYINDVRIYDHALSIKQIKEISKGLVLHYKLDDKYAESTVNLCNGLVKGGRTVVVGDTVTNTGENADTYWYIKPKEALVGGATYTVSCQLQGFSSDSDYISWGVCAQSGTNYAGSWKTYNGYNEFTFIMPDGLDGSTANIIFDDNGFTDRTQIFTISNIQLEKKDHATPYVGIGETRNDNIIYDSSGYQNNGTIIGIIQTINDSPRYSTSTSFDGNTSVIQVPFDTSAWQTNFTINLWFKKETLGTKNYETLFGGPSGFEMDTRAGAASTLSLYMTSTRGGTIFSPFEFNKWYMVTLVNNGTNQLYYINGELKKTIDVKPMPAGNYFIGSWQTAIKQNYYGYISDFRIYATALSSEDIKELYQTSALIDRNQNLYVREVIE